MSGGQDVDDFERISIELNHSIKIYANVNNIFASVCLTVG